MTFARSDFGIRTVWFLFLWALVYAEKGYNKDNIQDKKNMDDILWISIRRSIRIISVHFNSGNSHKGSSGSKKTASAPGFLSNMQSLALYPVKNTNI